MSTRATVRASELYADLQDVAAQYEHCLSVHKLSSDMSYLFSSESVRLAFAILPGIRCDSQVKILLQTKNKTILCTLLVKDRETTKNIIVNILDAMLISISPICTALSKGSFMVIQMNTMIFPWDLQHKKKTRKHWEGLCCKEVEKRRQKRCQRKRLLV